MTPAIRGQNHASSLGEQFCAAESTNGQAAAISLHHRVQHDKASPPRSKGWTPESVRQAGSVMTVSSTKDPYLAEFHAWPAAEETRNTAFAFLLLTSPLLIPL